MQPKIVRQDEDGNKEIISWEDVGRKGKKYKERQ